MFARVDDDTGVGRTDAPGSLRRPHQRKALHSPHRVGHAPLHRPVAHPQCRSHLGGDRAQREIAVIGVRRLFGDLQREP